MIAVGFDILIRDVHEFARSQILDERRHVTPARRGLGGDARSTAGYLIDRMLNRTTYGVAAVVLQICWVLRPIITVTVARVRAGHHRI
jgi:hypothetical protein